MGDFLIPIPATKSKIMSGVSSLSVANLSTKLPHFSFQGFNRIVAIALLFMHEEDAFWLLVYIVEHLMPPEYYSRDRQLIGCQVSCC